MNRFSPLLRRPFVLVVTGLMATLLFSCGGAMPCDARTCSGCCSPSGQCLGGTGDSQCGRGGAACTTCGSGRSCSLGECRSTFSGPGPSGSGGGTAGTGGGTSSSGGGTTSSTAPSCTVPEDCPYWYCDCRSGPPVNSRRCVNNRCQDGAQACPGACASFGTCWLGSSSGGFRGGSNVGPNTCSSGSGGGTANTGGGSPATCQYSDLGKSCDAAGDCQSALCFGVNPSFICTKACTTANDCPFGWVCDTTSSGGRVCMSGRDLTPRSTSTVCREVAHPDVGGPCVASCSGGHCVASTCTHRCNSVSDCPRGWSCSGTPFMSCRP